MAISHKTLYDVFEEVVLGWVGAVDQEAHCRSGVRVRMLDNLVFVALSEKIISKNKGGYEATFLMTHDILIMKLCISYFLFQ